MSLPYALRRLITAGWLVLLLLLAAAGGVASSAMLQPSGAHTVPSISSSHLLADGTSPDGFCGGGTGGHC